MTSAQSPKFGFAVILREGCWKMNHGKAVIGEQAWMMTHGGWIM
jgi:hypothetical protein